MIEVGDHILVVASGPHGAGLVNAVVVDVFLSNQRELRLEVRGIGHGDARTLFNVSAEGTTWCRGHDRGSPQAQALAVAAALR